VVGDGTASSASAAPKQPTTNAEQAHQQQVDSYRERIRGYQSQIDAIDQRIAQLKNFKADNTSPSGGININHGYDMVPLEDQVKQLEEQKKKVQAKLDDTEAEARQDGIEPGELR
jgi:chromosome segregation ATPase